MSKVPDQSPQTGKAVAGGVTNELSPDRTDSEAVRRRDDLTIRGADPKEIVPESAKDTSGNSK
ncbi:hypothetical protein IZ6_10750 [Terrihabitans soli]|uniref:Uncharacterized protein n=1 Tax=Terrihabitans soli TaxID=708113 RepID=A0A6S6QTS1_9HYPH|nr:hypothetical protein [Terrihabitans soli]BCJ90340.1 hypothetical protein IZ6_10750 [Terrihabitans soli]